MRELTFYLTGNRDRKFQKLIFSVSIDDLEDGFDWIDENIDRIYKKYEFDYIYDHIILNTTKTDKTIELTLIHTIDGKLSFEQHLSKEEIQLLIDENDTLKNENFNLRKENAILNKKLKKDYPSMWIDPLGKSYVVGFSCHNKFAIEYLDEHDYDIDCDDYPYEMLQNLGWTRILGWCDPPSFVIPKDVSKKVKSMIKDYCLDNGCDFPEGINFV